MRTWHELPDGSLLDIGRNYTCPPHDWLMGFIDPHEMGWHETLRTDDSALVWNMMTHRFRDYTRNTHAVITESYKHIYTSAHPLDRALLIYKLYCHLKWG